MDNDCVFCKIVSGEFDSARIWGDKNFLAILGNHPNTKGMTLVLTKKHCDSYAFDIPDGDYKELMVSVKKVSSILEKGLGVKRVAMIMEGMGVNHAHIKLYPLHGLNEKFKEMWGDKEVFFDRYEGYVTTLEGLKVGIDELKKLAREMKNAIQ
jgi:histidine triad (HIT) family protein